MATYNEQERQDIVSAYKAAGNELERREALEKLANKYDTSVASVRAVVVAAKVYVKSPYRNKQGKVPCRKEDLVTKFEDYLGVMPNDFESLSKANKSVIIKLIKKFVEKFGDPEGHFKEIL